MPLKLDIKRKLSARSDRVKCVDLHPTEPWMLAALYNGNVHVWNIDSQQLIKTFEVCDLPVRAAKFAARKNWMVSGSDDMHLRIWNYNTLERVHQFEAHSDYIRSIVIHPTQPFVLTSSDDMMIKLWNWEKNWACAQVFEGHTHYVMQLVVNPKDNNTFASASLDKTIKVWNLGSGHANFTLEGHEKGVNCIDYYSGGDKPYLVSGADDRLVKIWDYQTKTCVQTLEGHAQNVSCVSFHPELPIIMTGSEDGTLRVWHANTYRLESTLNYGLERVWTIACMRGSNAVALGYDEGSIIIKLGREEPAMSMDGSGKMVFAKHAELQQANIKAVAAEMDEIGDGERLPLNIKDMGSCEIYPQTIAHNANGRFVVVCGDGEYIVYTAMALRNKSFGSAQEFVWAQNDSSMYAIREGTSTVKVFKNFKEQRSFKPEFGTEQIFGGHVLGVRSVSGLAFYNWDTAELIRRIEITPRALYWNESGHMVAIVTDEIFYILKYNADVMGQGEEVTEDGYEGAFEVVQGGEVNDVVKTGVWVGDCFLYTNAANRLQYCVGGELVTVAHLDRQMYLLGYLPKENRVYLGDRDLNIVSYSLLLSVLEYQTAVMRGDFASADAILPTVPREQRSRVAHFLEKQGFQAQALAVTTDPEHKFDLALQLGDLKLAYQLADSDKENSSEQKWRQIADAATRACEFKLAQECLARAKDYGSLLLLATSSGNATMLTRVGLQASQEGKSNVAFLSKFLLGDLNSCLQLLIDTNRLPEAAFFARTYLPSRMPAVVEMWREWLAGKTSQKTAEALANPQDYPNLFPGLEESLKTEVYLSKHGSRSTRVPANAYPSMPANFERDTIAEMSAAEQKGQVFNPPPLDSTQSIVAGDQSINLLDANEEDNYQFKDATEDLIDKREIHRSSENDFRSKSPATVPPNQINSNTSYTKPKLPTTDVDDDIEEELERDIENMKIDSSVNDLDWEADDLSDEN